MSNTKYTLLKDLFWVEEIPIANEKIGKLAKQDNISKEDECKKLLEFLFINRNQNLRNNQIGYIGERDFEIMKDIYINKKTIKQIANEQNLSSERIRQLFSRGLRRFRYAFKKYLGIL